MCGSRSHRRRRETHTGKRHADTQGPSKRCNAVMAEGRVPADSESSRLCSVWEAHHITALNLQRMRAQRDTTRAFQTLHTGPSMSPKVSPHNTASKTSSETSAQRSALAAPPQRQSRVELLLPAAAAPLRMLHQVNATISRRLLGCASDGRAEHTHPHTRPPSRLVVARCCNTHHRGRHGRLLENLIRCAPLDWELRAPAGHTQRCALLCLSPRKSWGQVWRAHWSTRCSLLGGLLEVVDQVWHIVVVCAGVCGA